MVGLDQKKEVSPEEKLLSLISQKPASGGDVRSAGTATVGGREIRQLLKRLIAVLVVFCAGLACFVVWTIFFKAPERSLPEGMETQETKADADKAVVLPASPFGSFEDVIRKRDYFSAPEVKKPVTAAMPAVEVMPRVSTAEITAKYKVVGIVMDKDPQAVIEDVKNNSTLFLSRGDALGEGRIESIRSGKVVVAFGNQKVDLVP
ncbi:MAG: hypothetical protein WCO69_04915 [Candidatus Omnitrophota bacterium]